MRAPARIMALVTLAGLVLGAWATGCTDLSSDCELNLNCPPTVAPTSCQGLFFSPGCDSCLQGTCCGALGACNASNACMNGCVFGESPSPPACSMGETKELLDALGTCMTGACKAECLFDRCNPITSNGCPMAEAACDLVYPGMFVCLGFGASPAPLCGPCDNLEGPYCGPGLRCHHKSGTCARYCCSDADCGTGRCELDPMLAFGSPILVAGDNVGVCVTMDGTGPACDAPAVSPSGGTCAAGFPPM
ncbi:hypothetical protein [Polyangium aurulentum]|uniref:hypothetical protein n=1 Tax=Polyangium aurulentum TaxID=2567896 RepID=UPI00113BE06A|nr:hypothetical protein [Polyangium aurulentum]UQA56827.1 hypothetical protein E8A73_036830 [Polyangium aurulentum]